MELSVSVASPFFPTSGLRTAESNILLHHVYLFSHLPLWGQLSAFYTSLLILTSLRKSLRKDFDLEIYSGNFLFSLSVV